jgi:hypothetical protein
MAQDRHIPHSGTPPSNEADILEARRDIQAELAFSLRAIQRHQTSKHGVYVGAPGWLHPLRYFSGSNSSVWQQACYSCNGQLWM